MKREQMYNNEDASFEDSSFYEGTGIKVNQVLNGIKIITVPRFEDDRGFFQESFNSNVWKYCGLPHKFCQDNHSRSKKGVVRGMHFQVKFPMAKLLRVVRGEIMLVELDIRKDSPTYGDHVKIRLSEDDPILVWIPPGFANGFQVLSDAADVFYKCDEFRSIENERSIRWDSFGCVWEDIGVNPLLSDKDKNAMSFDEWNGSYESKDTWQRENSFIDF